MKVYIPVYFRDKHNKSNVRVIQYINPDTDDARLADFINSLNNLTDNQLIKVLKVVEDFLKPDDDIELNDIESVINHTYSPVEDDDGVTHTDIESIISGSYIPVEEVI